MTFHTLNELIADGVRGRYVLVRSDLNVPLDGSTVTDDGRIKASLPVLAKLTDAGARVLVTAHLGRPKGAPEEKYSLKPAAARLADRCLQPWHITADHPAAVFQPIHVSWENSCKDNRRR